MNGAFLAESGHAAIGVAIRDKDGQPLLMACRRVFHCQDAEEAEALACLEGVRMVARWPDQDFVLEAGNALVVEKLKIRGIDRSIVAPVIHDTQHEGELLRSLVVANIGREQNKVAHELAHLALCSSVSRVWFGDFPECVVTQACKDIFIN